MRLLVAPHELSIGGSQINAIDLAAGAAEAGHEVVVWGRPGPLVDYIESRGLEFIPARRLRYRPAPSRIAQLAAIASTRKLDLIHAYEWPPCLDAYFGAHLALHVPLVCTVLSMATSPYVPPSVPLIMGTEALGDEARRNHAAPVWVLEPPIDSDTDHPGVDGRAFRQAHGVAADSLLIVTVSRLAIDLKLDALVDAIDAASLLAPAHPVELLLVGGGEAEEALRSRAAQVNARSGRAVVRFTGPLSDPRAAYAAADVVVGMGSSSLRAASMGRPVVVQGERGFSKLLAPETLDHFLWTGFWGLGDGGSGGQALAAELAPLLEDPARRNQLGTFGRRLVDERFSLRRGVARQLEIYDDVLGARPARRPTEPAVAAGRALWLEVENHDPRNKRLRRESEHSRLTWAQRPLEAIG